MVKLIITSFLSVDGVMQALRYGRFSVDEQTSTGRLFKGEFRPA